MLLHTAAAFTHRPFTHKRLPPRIQNFAILSQRLTLEPHFVRKGCRRTNQTRKKPSVFDTRTSFRAKGLPPKRQNRDFTSAFDTRTSFRAADTSKAQFISAATPIELAEYHWLVTFFPRDASSRSRRRAHGLPANCRKTDKKCDLPQLKGAVQNMPGSPPRREPPRRESPKPLPGFLVQFFSHVRT